MSPAIIIKKGREKPILNQHPWIFSGAIDSVQGDPTPGDIVTVQSHDGRFLARGYWNPKSQIQVRILTWQDEEVNEDWWRKMLKRAVDARRKGAPKLPELCRLINAENDYIPGLIVDRYSNWLVIQSLTLGIERVKSVIVKILFDLLYMKDDIFGIYERSDVDVRGKEGLDFQMGLLLGQEPPELIEISKIDQQILVDIRRGHKTGFYLDQEDSRDEASYVLRFLPPDSRILNLFSYTSTFTLEGLIVPNVTQIVNVDSSRDALELGEEIFNRNRLRWSKSGFNFEFSDEKYEFIQADVFTYIRDQEQGGELFDFIILDPPKFAFNAGQIEKAARGYKDINLNAFKCVKPGGYLMTFSCSGAITADLFQKIVFGALADSGRQAQILKHLGPGDDHPVALTFPEGAYLKGLLLRVY